MVVLGLVWRRHWTLALDVAWTQNAPTLHRTPLHVPHHRLDLTNVCFCLACLELDINGFFLYSAPIIVVPPALTALCTVFNARDFLERGESAIQFGNSAELLTLRRALPLPQVHPARRKEGARLPG